MKAGVSIVPRGKLRRPRRAAPSVWLISYFMAVSSFCGACRVGNGSAEKTAAWAGTPSRLDRRAFARRPDQHRVAVGEEAIAFAHRMRVSGEHALAARERGDQHQQGRFGQMEIRDQSVDARDAVAREDEDLRL